MEFLERFECFSREVSPVHQVPKLLLEFCRCQKVLGISVRQIRFHNDVYFGVVVVVDISQPRQTSWFVVHINKMEHFIEAVLVIVRT